jgi:hypothetical protein
MYGCSIKLEEYTTYRGRNLAWVCSVAAANILTYRLLWLCRQKILVQLKNNVYLMHDFGYSKRISRLCAPLCR